MKQGLIQSRIRLRLDEMRKRISKKSLGLRSQSWQDTARVLSSVLERVASYAKPDNTQLDFNMSDRKDIEEKIASAMKVSCDEAFFFSEDESRLIDAEYLLTVNVAKEIVKLNKYIGIPYKIYLEKPTSEFASDCVPLMGRQPASNFLGYCSTLRKSKNTKRNGKIDVAVYRDGDFPRMPVCAIELKGFNPQRTVVLQDLKRNGEYFSLSCATGSSQISFSIFAALHSFCKTYNAESVKKDLQSLQAKYNKWLSELGGSRNYENNIEVFTISKSLADEQAIPPDEEFSEFESHHFVGVMVTFYSNEI